MKSAGMFPTSYGGLWRGYFSEKKLFSVLCIFIADDVHVFPVINLSNLGRRDVDKVELCSLQLAFQGWSACGWMSEDAGHHGQGEFGWHLFAKYPWKFPRPFCKAIFRIHDDDEYSFPVLFSSAFLHGRE